MQDLGFLAFTLPQVEILMPTKKPRGEELTLEQQRANQALHQRRLRIEHVNSSVKRCRIVKDRIRLWKEGVRDLVMELCCALHNFRVRLTPVAANDLIGINSMELYNTTAHQGLIQDHFDPPIPLAVLGEAKGRLYSAEELGRKFSHALFPRTTNPYGCVTLHSYLFLRGRGIFTQPLIEA